MKYREGWVNSRSNLYCSLRPPCFIVFGNECHSVFLGGISELPSLFIANNSVCSICQTATTSQVQSHSSPGIARPPRPMATDRSYLPDRLRSDCHPLHQFAAYPPIHALQLSVPPISRPTERHQILEFITQYRLGTDPADGQGKELSCLSFHLSAVIAAPAAGCGSIPTPGRS